MLNYSSTHLLFESNVILMDLMVIHSYLMKKNIHKYQKPSFERFALILNWISFLCVFLKAAVWLLTCWSNTSLRRGGEGRGGEERGGQGSSILQMWQKLKVVPGKSFKIWILFPPNEDLCLKNQNQNSPGCRRYSACYPRHLGGGCRVVSSPRPLWAI